VERFPDFKAWRAPPPHWLSIRIPHAREFSKHHRCPAPSAPPTNPYSSLNTSTMADAPRGGGFASRGDRGGDRGRGGRGRGRPRRGGAKSEEKEWQPVTKLGRLVKAGKIKSMEEIYLHSLPIKEYQIVDFFLPKLKDEVMKVRGLRALDIEETHTC
jgi:hypothetical protein